MQLFIRSRFITIFATMRRRRIILFKIFFFLAVFFNLGLDAHANFSFRSCATEVTTGTDSAKNYLGYDYDSIDDDEIAQSYNNGLTIEPIDLIITLQNYQLTKNFSFSVWQPPKLFR